MLRIYLAEDAATRVKTHAVADTGATMTKVDLTTWCGA